MADLWYYEEGDDPDRFDTPMAPALADECARFYGTGEVGRNFAQCLAAFLAVDQCRSILLAALTEGPDF